MTNSGLMLPCGYSTLHLLRAMAVFQISFIIHPCKYLWPKLTACKRGSLRLNRHRNDLFLGKIPGNTWKKNLKMRDLNGSLLLFWDKGWGHYFPYRVFWGMTTGKGFWGDWEACPIRVRQPRCYPGKPGSQSRAVFLRMLTIASSQSVSLNISVLNM